MLYLDNYYFKKIHNNKKKSNITIFYQYNQNIETINETYFEFLPNLIYIDLTYNQIKDIDRYSFSILTDLHYLYLSENSLRQINRWYFQKLNKLVILDLNSNLISFIENRSFDDLISLEKLYLNQNKIKAIKSETKHIFFLEKSCLS